MYYSLGGVLIDGNIQGNGFFLSRMNLCLATLSLLCIKVQCPLRPFPLAELHESCPSLATPLTAGGVRGLALPLRLCDLFKHSRYAETTEAQLIYPSFGWKLSSSANTEKWPFLSKSRQERVIPASVSVAIHFDCSESN